MKPRALSVAQIICRYLPPILSQRIRPFIYTYKQACKDDYYFIHRAQTGSNFKSKTSDFHGYPFSVHGYYHWHNWAIALALCSSGDNIIEIGGNIGTETVGFSDIVGQSGNVFVFEPLPSNIDRLIDTMKINNFPNVILCPYAVSNENGKLNFAIPYSKNLSGIGHIVRSNNISSQVVEVYCVTLDFVEYLIEPAKVIFMDVEGEEINILKGAKNYLNKNRPYLVLEADPKHLARGGFKPADLFDTINELSYEPYLISGMGVKKVSPHDVVKGCDIFCIPINHNKSKILNKIHKSILLCGFLPCISGLNPMTKPFQWIGS
jgi:FkbM family methyltransferase